MASICRKRGASGKVSPYWQAKFRSADGSTVWRSTKQTDSRKAIEVARKWEKAARLASGSELTQAASIRLLDELMEVTICSNGFSYSGRERLLVEQKAERKIRSSICTWIL